MRRVHKHPLPVIAGEVVYGFLDPASGEILYVGSTTNVKMRVLSHRSTKPFLKECDIVLFRMNPKTPLLIVEARIIEAYKRRGQCKLNDDKHHRGQLKVKKLDQWRGYDEHAKSQRTTLNLIEMAIKGVLEKESPWGWTEICCHAGKALKSIQKLKKDK